MSRHNIVPLTEGGKQMFKRATRRSWSSVAAASVITASVLLGVGGSAAAYAQSASTRRTDTSSPVKLVYVNPLTATPDWGRSDTYLLNDQKKYGYSATVTGPTTTLDIPTMVTEIQEAIANKDQIIMTCACATGAFNHVFSLARKAGIVVVTIGADAPGSSLFFGTNYVNFGRKSAQDLITKLNGQANIGIVSTNGTTANQVQEIVAFKAALKGHPGMKILDSVYDNSDTSTAETEIGEMLAADPSINAIWTVEGAAPGAAPTALQEAGKKPGQVTVLAIDLEPPTRAAIKDGWIWASEYQRFFDAVPLAASCAVKLFHGAQEAHSVDTGALLVTKANVPSTLPPKNEGLPTSC